MRENPPAHKSIAKYLNTFVGTLKKKKNQEISHANEQWNEIL